MKNRLLSGFNYTKKNFILENIIAEMARKNATNHKRK
jgi:hypothetical protein